MKTCPKCRISPAAQIRMEASLNFGSQEQLDKYNEKLEELRADGYVWNPETRAMIKQCDVCAASDQETRDETSGTENQDPPANP